MMGATGQPYSDAALTAAWATRELTTEGILDAAHDREALGLDASVHAASYRREVLNDVVEYLDGLERQYADRAARAILDLIEREPEATEAKP